MNSCQIDRFREPPNSGPMCDVIWSDPMSDFGSERERDYFQVNEARGCAYFFSWVLWTMFDWEFFEFTIQVFGLQVYLALKSLVPKIYLLIWMQRTMHSNDNNVCGCLNCSKMIDMCSSKLSCTIHYVNSLCVLLLYWISSTLPTVLFENVLGMMHAVPSFRTTICYH